MSLEGAEETKCMQKSPKSTYLILQSIPTPMDEFTLMIGAACAALAVLVYLMWRAATKQSWGELTKQEKKEWRMDEEKRKGIAG
jgi:hypothetical protein